jgi:hypothetical protein
MASEEVAAKTECRARRATEKFAVILRFNTGLTPALLVLGCIPAFADGDGGGGLAVALKQHYKLATVKFGVNGDSTFEPGTILVIRKDGILSFGEQDASYAALCPSEIQGRAVHTPRNPACTRLAPKSRRLLKPSERVCVTAINVNEKSDVVSFFVATFGPADSADKSAPRRALIVFHLPKGSLAGTTAAKIENVIGQTLSEAERKSVAAPPFREVTDGVQPPAESTPAEPVHPPEGVAGVKTVTKGQTMDEVQAILGPPTTISDWMIELCFFIRL